MPTNSSQYAAWAVAARTAQIRWARKRLPPIHAAGRSAGATGMRTLRELSAASGFLRPKGPAALMGAGGDPAGGRGRGGRVVLSLICALARAGPALPGSKEVAELKGR